MIAIDRKEVIETSEKLGFKYSIERQACKADVHKLTTTWVYYDGADEPLKPKVFKFSSIEEVNAFNLGWKCHGDRK